MNLGGSGYDLRDWTVNLRSWLSNLRNPDSNLRSPSHNLRTGVLKEVRRKTSEHKPHNVKRLEFQGNLRPPLGPRKPAFTTPMRRFATRLRRCEPQLRRFMP